MDHFWDEMNRLWMKQRTTIQMVILNDLGELVSDYKRHICLMHTNGRNQWNTLKGLFVYTD